MVTVTFTIILPHPYPLEIAIITHTQLLLHNPYLLELKLLIKALK